MQPGIAFPRALQGETLDFSEPQPNRCWLLESHQKQAFMLLSFSLSSTLSLSCFSLPFPLSLFHAFLSLPFLSLVARLSLWSLILLPLSHNLFSDSLPPLCQGQHLSVLISLQRAVQTDRCLASKVCSASVWSNFLLQNPFVRCFLFCASTSEQGGCTWKQGKQWNNRGVSFSVCPTFLLSSIHPKVHTPTFSFLLLCCPS